MGTTAVVAEMLIAGFEALLWIFILIQVFVDVTAISRYETDKDWINLYLVIILPFAYSLGVMIDRVADTVLDKWDRVLQDRCIRSTEIKSYNPICNANILKLYVMHKSDGVTKFLDYQRSRTRVARSTTINVSLTIFALIFSRTMDFPNLGHILNITNIYRPLLYVLFGVFILSFYGWVRITRSYYARLEQAYEILSAESAIQIKNGLNAKC